MTFRPVPWPSRNSPTLTPRGLGSRGLGEESAGFVLDSPHRIDLASRLFGAWAGPRSEGKRVLFGIMDMSGGVHVLAEIKIQEGESIENALRRFKRKVQQEDIIKDIKKHSFYLKPGDKKRAKQALARKRNRKKIRRETE